MAITQFTHGIGARGRVARRVVAPVVIAAALALTLGACSPTAGSASPSGGSSNGGGSSSGGSSSGSTSAGATFSGSESGKVVMNLCTASGTDSVYVTVDGSSEKLPGAVSTQTMDFNGSDSIYTIDKTGPLPKASADGNSYALDGVVLKSVIDPTKKITFTGTVTCP